MSNSQGSRPNSCGFFYDHVPKMPAEPTSHKVGSWERLEVMRARAEADEELWHPDDERNFCPWPEHMAMKNRISETYGRFRGLKK